MTTGEIIEGIKALTDIVKNPACHSKEGIIAAENAIVYLITKLTTSEQGATAKPPEPNTNIKFE